MDEPYRHRANPRVRLNPPGRQDREKTDGHGARFADGKAAIERRIGPNPPSSP
ncbi:hypothetical protein [Sphingobium cupriresistens]|uniref:hypothetical protein n=1 Tax=Sphingobium cupriresistens TaxID=1132417 RepID=UPI00146FDDC7|nr:hypothetical protein [Sphingobium cupriresistens]